MDNIKRFFSDLQYGDNKLLETSGGISRDTPWVRVGDKVALRLFVVNYSIHKEVFPAYGSKSGDRLMIKLRREGKTVQKTVFRDWLSVTSFLEKFRDDKLCKSAMRRISISQLGAGIGKGSIKETPLYVRDVEEFLDPVHGILWNDVEHGQKSNHGLRFSHRGKHGKHTEVHLPVFINRSFEESEDLQQKGLMGNYSVLKTLTEKRGWFGPKKVWVTHDLYHKTEGHVTYDMQPSEKLWCGGSDAVSSLYHKAISS